MMRILKSGLVATLCLALAGCGFGPDGGQQRKGDKSQNTRNSEVTIPPEPIIPPTRTNELLCLVIRSEGSYSFLSCGTNGAVQLGYGSCAYPAGIQRILPNDSKPLVLSRGSESRIQTASNATWSISNNKKFIFQLDMGSDKENRGDYK